MAEGRHGNKQHRNKKKERENFKKYNRFRMVGMKEKQKRSKMPVI